MTIKELRQSLGLTQIEFGERFGGIPRRTLQGWESGDRVPPPYIVWMINEIIKMQTKD